MAVERCSECEGLVDLDENLEDWDFDKKACRRCVESKQLIERVEE
jgi:hypothetical protein